MSGTSLKVKDADIKPLEDMSLGNCSDIAVIQHASDDKVQVGVLEEWLSEKREGNLVYYIY